MSITTITELYVFILAGFLGYQLVTRVPPLLHTPLMSATNAICGISLVGALVETGAHHSTLSTILGTVAVASAAVNVVGGFLMTDRMLRMFKRQPSPTAAHRQRHRRPYHRSRRAPPAALSRSLTNAAHAVHRGVVPRRVHPVHSGSAEPHADRAGAARHAAGRARHAARDHRHARQSLDHRVPMDRGRARGRVPDRLPTRHVGSHDLDASGDRDLAPVRRARGDARGSGRISQRGWCGRGGPHDRARLRGDAGLADRHRQLHGLREAAGDRDRPAGHVSRTERIQHRAVRGDGRDLHLPDRILGAPDAVLHDGGLRAGDRRLDGPSRSAAPTCRW